MIHKKKKRSSCTIYELTSSVAGVLLGLLIPVSNPHPYLIVVGKVNPDEV